MAKHALRLNPVELILCAQTLVQEAGRFGGIADTLSQSPANQGSTVFGTLPAASRLAGLTAEVNEAANGQFRAASTFLSGTEYALDQVLQEFLSTEGANSALAAAASAIRREEGLRP